ncbi:MAG: hypothetical protein ACLS5G_07905 [Streptococcus sp.]
MYDATTIRNIVEMIDSITTNVSYTRSSRQDLVNTASSDNTYSGSQDLNLASKTTTQEVKKEQLKTLRLQLLKQQNLTSGRTCCSHPYSYCPCRCCNPCTLRNS